MFNQLNIKHLTITFFVLLAIVLLGFIGGNDGKERSFKSELTSFDSSAVNKIIIHPKAGGELVSLTKKNGNWFVYDTEGDYSADINQVSGMLSSLSNLKAKRLAAKGEDKWGKYELTDSLGIRVELKTDDETLADLYIGKFSYSAPPQGANPYMQGNRGTMTNFVRLADESEVYAVDGFLSMTFSRPAKDYRDSKILNLQKDSLSRITISHPGENFSLTKNDSLWLAGGLLTDSAAMADYLSNLSYLRSTDFISKNNAPVGSPTHMLQFEDAKGTELAKVEAFYTDSANISLKSSLNPGTYFDGVKSGVFEKLFKDEGYFVKKE